MKYLTVPLKASHKKQDFSCGKLLLDNYLHRQAKQDVKKFLSVCFILADTNNRVLGYYTLSNLAIPKLMVPAALLKQIPPSYTDLPVTLLGRLAVDQTETGKGIGGKLLIDALKRSYDTSSVIGSMAVIVDPLDKEAENFYAAYGFISLQDSGKMFLPMKTVAKLF